MGALRDGWRIQIRVIGALIVRELTTRFGRENIGFLWMMVEPLLFALLVGVIWRWMKGPEEHGINIIAFVVSGYLPLVMFRNSVNRGLGLFQANASLMYHRQIKILDFVFVRFLVEFMGHTMAYVFVMMLLMPFGEFPVPYDVGYLLGGWIMYGAFSLALCMIIAPASESSEVVEKLMPVTVYVMIPFSGTFTMTSWLSPAFQNILYYAPPVSAMEMMRHGLFGPEVNATWNWEVPFYSTLFLMVIGLAACRRIRRSMVVE